MKSSAHYKIALLGAQDSGKTTFFKVARSLFGEIEFHNFHQTPENKYFIQHHLQYEIIDTFKRIILFLNKKKESLTSNKMENNRSPVNVSIHQIGKEVKQLTQQQYDNNSRDNNVDYDNFFKNIEIFNFTKNEEKSIERLQNYNLQNVLQKRIEITYEGGKNNLILDIKQLWKNNTFKYFIQNSNDYNFTISEHFIYFIKNINRIFKDDFKIIEEDYLKLYIPTLGLNLIDLKILNFKKNNFKINLIDIGGDLSQRRKWKFIYEKLQPNIFIQMISLADFFKLNFTNNNNNSILESIKICKEICQSINQMYILQQKRIDFILIFTKNDIFKYQMENYNQLMIDKLNQMSHLFTDIQFKENNILQFIGKLFYQIIKENLNHQISSINNNQLNIHMYEICCFDKNEIKFIFEEGIEPLLSTCHNITDNNININNNNNRVKDHNFRILLDGCETISDEFSNASFMKNSGNITKYKSKWLSRLFEKKTTTGSVSSINGSSNNNSFLSGFRSTDADNMYAKPPSKFGNANNGTSTFNSISLTIEEEEKINNLKEDETTTQLFENYSKKYIIKKRIGGGGQGTTYIVNDSDSNDSKMFYVMKRVKLKTIEELNESFNEIKSLYELRHENINSIHDFFIEQKESTIIADHLEQSNDKNIINNTTTVMNEMKQEYVLCLILQFCKGGDLRMYLDRFKKKGMNSLVSESQAIKWIKKLVSALVFIQSKGYLHRDLKPENIFFADTDRQELRLGDFGLSCVMKRKRTEKVGTEIYASPELMNGQEYSASSDIWSLGVIILEILTQRQVNVRLELEKDPSYVQSLCRDLQDVYSEELLDFMESCLQLDPEQRPYQHEQLLAYIDNLEG
ncbi:hypothetical protein ABK040_005274 [Willaertia magna]